VKTLRLIACAVVLCASSAGAEIQTKELSYSAGDVQMKGFLAYDDATDNERPGVLVVHEWWGHNPYARKRARMLAELGYTALAVDMYGDGKLAEHPKDAGKFSSAVMGDMDSAKSRFLAAMALLQAHPTTDPERTAAIGYCFGGGVVLHMARLGVDLDGVVSFHGSLGTETPAKKGGVKPALLVCHGADDPFTPQEQIEALKKEMADAGANLTFIAYEGAVHSFTNPDADRFGKEFELPLAYHKVADETSWADMQKFFKKIF